MRARWCIARRCGEHPNDRDRRRYRVSGRDQVSLSSDQSTTGVAIEGAIEVGIQITGEEQVMSVRIIVADGDKVHEREMNVRSFDPPPSASVKSLADLMVKQLMDDVNGWRNAPQSKGQQVIPGTEDV